jgi:MoaA/NifB/PqqE/SkfB family radical SAM enzyme
MDSSTGRWRKEKRSKRDASSDASPSSVKKESLVDIYRGSELFTTLRDSANLKGKCGVCESPDSK